MPYFIYRLTPPKRLQLLERFDNYREARDFARNERKAMTPTQDATVKVIFAPTQEQAEKLLTTEREPRPLGEDA